MELLHRRCCGLDVHKETVVAGPTSTARSARMTRMRHDQSRLPALPQGRRPGSEALLYGPRHHGEVQRSIAVCFEQKVVGDQECEGGRNSTHRQRANRTIRPKMPVNANSQLVRTWRNGCAGIQAAGRFLCGIVMTLKLVQRGDQRLGDRRSIQERWRRRRIRRCGTRPAREAGRSRGETP